MGSEKTKKGNPKMQKQQLNPNWALLRQKLKSSGKPIKSETATHNSILGKRKERSDAVSDDSRHNNPLAPTSSDSSLTDSVAIDCEMVGVSPSGNKSALGRVTLFSTCQVNKWGNVIYDEHVRPIDYVVDFRTKISGIRPRDLRKAKGFSIVQKEVSELIKGRIIVGHALRNDFKALLLSHPKNDIRDTSEYLPLLKEGRSRSLRHLAAEFLGANIQNGEHCPIEDARAAMLLYQKHRKEWERTIKESIRLTLKQKKHKQKKRVKEGNNMNASNAATAS